MLNEKWIEIISQIEDESLFRQLCEAYYRKIIRKYQGQ